MGGQQVAGPTLSQAQLESAVREIISPPLLPQLSQDGTFSFPYQSPSGAFDIQVEQNNGTLRVALAPIATGQPQSPTGEDAVPDAPETTEPARGVVRQKGGKGRRGTRAVWVLAVLLALVVGAGGLHFYKVHSVQQQLRAIAVRDNVLVDEALNLAKVSPSMTAAQYKAKLEKNVEEREALIREVKVIDAYSLRPAVDQYVKLLQLENECFRAQALYVPAFARYAMSADQRMDADMPSSERVTFLLGLYGGSQDEVDRQLSEDRQAARERLDEAVDEVTSLLTTMAKAFDNWAKAEATAYPGFLPPRNCLPTLKEHIARANKERAAVRGAWPKNGTPE